LENRALKILGKGDIISLLLFLRFLPFLFCNIFFVTIKVGNISNPVGKIAKKKRSATDYLFRRFCPLGYSYSYDICYSNLVCLSIEFSVYPGHWMLIEIL